MVKNYVRLLILPLIILLLTQVVIYSSKGKQEEQNKIDKTVKYGLLKNPQTIDPTMNTQSEVATVLANAFEGLLSIGKNKRITAAAAEKWEISKDGLEYIFYLRQDARWSDGERVRASDFEYAWKRALSPEVKSANAHQLYAIKNAKNYNLGIAAKEDVAVKAEGDLVLKVTLESKVDNFLLLTTLPVYFPLREDVVEGHKDWHLNPSTYVVNGPFRMIEWIADNSILFERNSNYWKNDELPLRFIEYKILGDQDRALKEFDKGELDILLNPPKQEETQVIKGALEKAYPRAGVFYYAINFNYKGSPMDKNLESALKDVRVRKALSLAIDRNKLVSEAAEGILTAAGGFLPEALRSFYGKSFFSDSLINTKGEIEKAQRLLKEAGYPEGRGFPKLSILYNKEAKEKEIVMQTSALWQKNLNIEVEIIEEEEPIFLKRISLGDYLIVALEKRGSQGSIEEFLSLCLGDSESNIGGYNNKGYDELIKRARQDSSLSRSFNYYKAAELKLMKDMPVIPIFYYTDILYTRENIKGIVVSPLGQIYFKEVYFD